MKKPLARGAFFWELFQILKTSIKTLERITLSSGCSIKLHHNFHKRRHPIVITADASDESFVISASAFYGIETSFDIQEGFRSFGGALSVEAGHHEWCCPIVIS